MKLSAVLIFVAIITLTLGQNVTVNNPVHPLGNGSKIESHIVAGTPASLGLFPFQAALLISSIYGSSLCGGSLIHKSWVLTAAHCMAGVNNVTVRLGIITLSTAGGYFVTVGAGNVVTHPFFTSAPYGNDVALINVGNAVPIGTNIQVIQLAKLTTQVLPPASLVVSGWGRTCTNCTISNILLCAAVVAIPTFPNCASAYAAGRVTNNTVCTKALSRNLTQSTCYGDSGGPLITTGSPPLLVGVVSFGGDTCDQGGIVPIGYMRTTSFCAWIITKIPDFVC